MTQKKVAIAISGGVDSSVSAWLLKEQGYDLIALHMKLVHGIEGEKRAKSCCSLDEALSARSVCEQLDIPFYVIDFQEEFQSTVIQYFVNEYVSGRTPNPCVMCNRAFKSHYLLKHAQDLGCNFLATGHYARVISDPKTGRTQLLRAKDRHKDQSYFLHGIDARDLPYFLFPLANYQKSEVRALAEQQSFVSAHKAESQDICFVSRNYRDFVKQQLPEPALEGDFVNLNGDTIGIHNGLPYYTIGQRRGLGISDASPYYVIRLDSQKNEVVLGKESDLYSHDLWVSEVNWISIAPLQKPLRVQVQLRYAHSGSTALLTPESPQRVHVQFEEAQRAIAPGQAAVFYQDEVLLGGGWIETQENL